MKPVIYGRQSKDLSLTIALVLVLAVLGILAESFCRPAFSQTSFEAILNQSDDHQRLKSFSSVTAKDPHFRVSVEESMKILYRNGDWDKFFSYAQFYRKYFEPKSYSDVALLEPLALLRHCQYESLFSLVDRLKSKRSDWSKELAQILALANIKFEGKRSKIDDPGAIGDHFTGKALWKAESEKVGKVHPRMLNVKVENKCE